VGTVQYDDARVIRPEERDVALYLDDPEWPNSQVALKDWVPGTGCLTRTVEDKADEDKAKKEMAQPIKETLLRFPSAPLHGWQRLHESHVNLGDSENFHTYRVFSDPDYTGRIEHIFLMNNGLNETNTMGLYYRLASHLINAKKETACVLRPFPGHFTRFRYQAFAETPLDRYLWDGSNLFRQFLRYMIETQWFLSAIVRRSTYRSMAGADLLAEHDDPQKSRLNDEVLAYKMRLAWDSLREESVEALKVLHDGQCEAPPVKELPEDRMFLEAIESLRTCLGLEGYEWLDGELKEGQEEPSLHVIGYSLGGFTAQSIFMSWPFLVASCATLLSGGALRELSPTAFAHPEEWQTVLRSLRYELDDAMMSNLYNRYDGHVAGIDKELFLYLKRTFYEVFQQEYRGSIQSRFAAFRQRMLFVVGGNDPIVQTRSVLDSGPPGGINVLAIGGLGHFLDAKAQDEEEEEQRSFWLPEVGRLIDSFSGSATDKQSEDRPYTWLDYGMKVVKLPKPRGKQSESEQECTDEKEALEPLSASERLAIKQDGALPGGLFERCLDDLLARQGDNGLSGGLLFVLRNEVPTMLLDEPGIYENATMLNHDDVGTARCVQGVQRRGEAFFEYRERVALVLPWNVRRIRKRMDLHNGYPTQAEAAKGRLPTLGCEVPAGWERAVVPNEGPSEGALGEETPQELQDDRWAEYFRACEKLAEGKGSESVRVFNGRPAFEDPPKINELTRRLINSRDCHKSMHPILGPPSSLPDCWVWMSWEYLKIYDKSGLTIAKGIERLASSVPQSCETHDALAQHLNNEDLRIITVSRARYNPRFRGRIVADPRYAMIVLYHMALCVTTSVPLAGAELENDYLPEDLVPT
jgi:hypothetical protein